jgi:hypothetical protein
MTTEPPKRTLATGPITFDPTLKTTDLSALPVPTDQADPQATVIRAGDPITRNPEFGRWLRKRGVDDRFVHRIEIRRDLLTVTAYRRKGHVEKATGAAEGVEVLFLVTAPDGSPVDDTPIVIRLAGVHEFPPGVSRF